MPGPHLAHGCLKWPLTPSACPAPLIHAGDPFFGAQVKDTTTKHTRTSSCFQKSPPGKGKVGGIGGMGGRRVGCGRRRQMDRRALSQFWCALEGREDDCL